MGTLVSGVGWAVWHSFWILLSALSGLGLATLGVGSVLSFIVITLLMVVYFISTIAWHTFLKEVSHE